MATHPEEPAAATDSKPSVPAGTASSLVPEHDSTQFTTATPSVKLPPMSPRAPSVSVSQQRSILKTASVTAPSPPAEAPGAGPVTDGSPQSEEQPSGAADPAGAVGSAQAGPTTARPSAGHTEAALVASAVLAVLVATVAFVAAVLDRAWLFRLAGEVQTRYMEVLPPDWLEVAVCFGPRLPAGALLNTTIGAAPSSVDDADTYRRLFGAGFDWRRSPFELLATPAAEVAQQMSRMRVTTSEKRQTGLYYTDMPLLLHYSLCRNFSGLRWSPARGEGEHWLDLTISTEERDKLLDGVTASFVDVFAYERGAFSEFFAVSPQLAFRTDLRRPLRLRLEAKLHRRMDSKHDPCESSEVGGDSASCLPWCLTRALLRRAGCTMPWMDALIFNMTAVRMSERAVPTERDPELFSAATARPWMTEFAALPPCASAGEFNASFRLVDALLLHERTPVDPEALRCRTSCPPPCGELQTRLRLAGGTLSAHGAVSLLRIEVPHSLPTHRRRTLFETRALLLETAGLLAFLFGASLLGVHDCCFVSAYWLLNKAGLLEQASGGHRAPEGVDKGGQRTPEGHGESGEETGQRDERSGGVGGYVGNSGGSMGRFYESSNHRVSW